jgi:phage tail-like protein
MTTRPRPDPYRSFNFIVHLDGVVLGGFSAVSGLSTEMSAIDYRAGSDTATGGRKIQGQHEAGNITLKRGVVNDTAFQQWRTAGATARRRATIVLYDAAHRPLRRWQLAHAWPSKVEGPAFNAKGNEVAVESLELTHEGLTVED